MATSLNTGVPWVMCQQADAPDPIVSSISNVILNCFKGLCFSRLCFFMNIYVIFSACYLFDMYIVYRLTLAMDFTVINSHQTLTRNQSFGLRIGVDGEHLFPQGLCILFLPSLFFLLLSSLISFKTLLGFFGFVGFDHLVVQLDRKSVV